MSNPVVKDMLIGYLRDHGFDGLYQDWGGDGCGCTVDDLIPCGDLKGDCTAGYERPCDCGDHDTHIEPR